MDNKDQGSNDSPEKDDIAATPSMFDDDGNEDIAAVVEGSIASENTTSQDCEYEEGSEGNEGDSDENGSEEGDDDDDEMEEVEEEVYEDVAEGEEGEVVEIEEWVTDEEDESEDVSPEISQQGGAASMECDSDGGETDGCPICLNRFRDQDIGTPESCDHNFCLECIQEWAKNVNTCPVDRRVFRLILAKHSTEDVIFKKIPVEDRSFGDDEEDDDVTYCEVCGQCDREDRLLLCDGCDLGFHCECLTPPLDRVPVEEWFCAECSSLNRDEVAEEVNDDDEVRYIIAENIANLPPLRPRRRLIARTRVAERVRARIEETRSQRARIVRQILESSESEEASAPSSSKPKRAAKSKTTSKRKSTKKKKVVKRKVVRKKKLVRKRKRKLKKGRSRRRKKGKSKSAAGSTNYLAKQMQATRNFKSVSDELARQKHAELQQKLNSGTVKSRLAGKLRLSNPPVGRTIPMQKTDKVTESRRGDRGLSSFSIMGDRDGLLHIESEEPEPSASSSKDSSRSGKYSKSSLKFHWPVGKPYSTKKHPSIEIKKTPAQASGATFDLLGSIMEKQDILNMESEQVTINRDGSLTAKQSDSPTEGRRSATPVEEFTSFPVAKEIEPADQTEGIRSISPTEEKRSDSSKNIQNSCTSGNREWIFDNHSKSNREKVNKAEHNVNHNNKQPDSSSKVNSDTDIDLFAAFSETLKTDHSMLGQYRRNIKSASNNKTGDNVQVPDNDNASPDLDNDDGEIIDTCSGGDEYSLVSEEEDDIINQETYEVEKVVTHRKHRHNDSDRRHSRKKEKRKSKNISRRSSDDSDDSVHNVNKYYCSEYKSRLPFPDIPKSSKRKSDSVKEDLVISIDNSLVSSRRSVLEKNNHSSRSMASWDKKESSSHRRSHKDSDRDRRYLEKERKESLEDLRIELSRYESRSRHAKDRYSERERRSRRKSRSRSHDKYSRSKDRYRYSKSPERTRKRRHRSRSRSMDRSGDRDRSHRRRRDRSRERAGERRSKRSRSRSRSPRRRRESEHRRREERSKVDDKYKRDAFSHKRFSDVELDTDSKKPRFLQSEIGEYRFERDSTSSSSSSSDDDVTEVTFEPVEEEIQVVEIRDSSAESGDDDDVQFIEDSGKDSDTTVPAHKETLDERIESLKAAFETEIGNDKEPEIHQIESVSSSVDNNVDKPQETAVEDNVEPADKEYDPAHPTEEETQLSLSPVPPQLVHSFQLEKDPSTLPEVFQLEKDPSTLPEMFPPPPEPPQEVPVNNGIGEGSVLLPSGPNIQLPVSVEMMPAVRPPAIQPVQPGMPVQQRPFLMNPMFINRPAFGRFPNVQPPVPQMGWQPGMIIPNQIPPAGPPDMSNGRFESVRDSVPPPPPPPFGQLVRPLRNEVHPSQQDLRLNVPPPSDPRQAVHQNVVRPIPTQDLREPAPTPTHTGIRFRIPLPTRPNIRILPRVTSHSLNIAPPPPVPLNSAPPISIPLNPCSSHSVLLNSAPPISVPLHSAPPISVPHNSGGPHTVPLNSAPPISVPLHSAPPISVPHNSVSPNPVPLNSAPPISVPLNSVPPNLVPLNSAPPISVPLTSLPPPSVNLITALPPRSVPLNSAPHSVPLNSAPPISVPINSVPHSVPLISPPPHSIPMKTVPHSVSHISEPLHSVPFNSAPPISVPLNSVPPSAPLVSEPPHSVPLNSAPPVSVPLKSDAHSVPIISAPPSVSLNSAPPSVVPRSVSPNLTPPVSKPQKQTQRSISPIFPPLKKVQPSLPSSIKKLTADLTVPKTSAAPISNSKSPKDNVSSSSTSSVSLPHTTAPQTSISTISTSTTTSATFSPITSSSVNRSRKSTSPKLFKQTFESVSVASKKDDKPKAKSVPVSEASVPPINQLEVLGKLLKTQVQLATIVNKNKSSSKTSKGTVSKSDDRVFKVPLPPRTSSQLNLSKSNSNHKAVIDSSELIEVVDMDMSPIDDDTSIEVSKSPDFDDIVKNYKHPSKTSKKSPDFDEIVKNFKQSSKTSKKSPDLDEIVKSYKQPSSKTSKKSPDFDDLVKPSSKSSKKPKLRDGDFKKVINKISKEEEDPSSAVDLTNKEKYLKKLHLQERVVEEVKEAIKPYYSSKKITKEEYKDILRKAVPKICHSKSGNVNPQKIRALVGAYVEKLQSSSIRLEPRRRDKNKSKNSDIFKGKVNR